MDKASAEATLGITGVYSADDLHDKYIAGIKANHPDVVAAEGGDASAANDRTAEINEAYDFLKDLFEETGRLCLSAEGAMPSVAPSEGDPSSRVRSAAESAEREAPRSSRPAQGGAVSGEAERNRASSGNAGPAGKKAAMDSKPASPGKDAPKPSVRKRLVPFFSHFPYRLALILIAFAFLCAIMKLDVVDLVANLGFSKPDSDVQIEPISFIVAIAFFGAAAYNVVRPFITDPIRKGILKWLKEE